MRQQVGASASLSPLSPHSPPPAPRSICRKKKNEKIVKQKISHRRQFLGSSSNLLSCQYLYLFTSRASKLSTFQAPQNPRSPSQVSNLTRPVFWSACQYFPAGFSIPSSLYCSFFSSFSPSSLPLNHLLLLQYVCVCVCVCVCV